MEIKGKVHCFFEQSGTFKNEFKKLGYDAYDYDIQNNFGETDYVIDLFKEIENAYDDKPSIFDKIISDDLVLAFFPCIYFSALSQIAFSFGCKNYRKLTVMEKSNKIIERSHNREKFFRLCGEERSMISPDYARNFILDFILGKQQKISQLTLF